MKLIEEMMNKKAEMEIAPLIDVVFLLLIYFMVTASLVKKEADLSFMLPAPSSTDLVELPLEVLIEVSELGDIVINGQVFGKDSDNLDDLKNQLASFKAAAEQTKSEMVVNILPADEAVHGRITRVMDACAAARISNVSFSMTM